VHGEYGRVAVPVYSAHLLRLNVQRDCLTRSSNTCAFSQQLFIPSVYYYHYVGGE